MGRRLPGARRAARGDLAAAGVVANGQDRAGAGDHATGLLDGERAAAARADRDGVVGRALAADVHVALRGRRCRRTVRDLLLDGLQGAAVAGVDGAADVRLVVGVERLQRGLRGTGVSLGLRVLALAL